MKNFSPRTLLWLVFAGSLLLLWNNWQLQHAPAPTTLAAQVVGGNGVAGAVNASTAGAPAADSVQLKGQLLVLENDVLRLKLNTEGGVIQFAELMKFKNSSDKNLNVLLLNADPQSLYVTRSGLANPELNLNHKTMFTASAPETVMKDGQDAVSVTLVANNNGVTLRKVYTLKRGSYSVDVKHEIDNDSAAAIAPRIYFDIVRDASQIGDSQFYSTYTGPVVYNDEDKFKKVSFDDIAKGKVNYTPKANNGWVGMVQHYFVSSWVIPQGLERDFYTRVEQTAPFAAYSVGEVTNLPSIAPAAKASFDAQLYVGPQDQKILATVAPGLDLAVDYDWLTIIAKPVHWFMGILHAFIGNWGWTIIALTILMKLAFFPLTAASYKSMAKMKALAPKLKVLQEDYGNDKLKLNQATMELYKSEKVNPAGGCLPMLVQMPIFIALYYVLQAAVEMRGAPWTGWIKDLSAPDPLWILPVIYMVTMFIQTKLNPTPADPMQARMMLMMPLIFGVTFFFFPSGLVLYWVVSNIFSIGQQWYINKHITNKPVKA